MTKTTYITKLEEIKGIKVICKNCKSNWFVPFNKEMLEDVKGRCVSCGKEYSGNKLFKIGLRINELLVDSQSAKFDFVIETDFEK